MCVCVCVCMSEWVTQCVGMCVMHALSVLQHWSDMFPTSFRAWSDYRNVYCLVFRIRLKSFPSLSYPKAVLGCPVCFCFFLFVCFGFVFFVCLFVWYNFASILKLSIPYLSVLLSYVQKVYRFYYQNLERVLSLVLNFLGFYSFVQVTDQCTTIFALGR